MHESADLFFDAARLYPEFKKRFGEFLAELNGELASAPDLADVALKSGADGVSAELSAFGEAFSISFQFLRHDGTCFGVLQVFAPETSYEHDVLWQVFFDQAGKARQDIDEPGESESLTGAPLVRDLLGVLAQTYLSRFDEDDEDDIEGDDDEG